MGASDNARSGNADGPVVISEGTLIDVLHILDDLAETLRVAAQVARPPDRGTGPTFVSGLADQIEHTRAALRRPEDDAAGMGFGAGEWRTALCSAFDNVPLVQASLADLRRRVKP